MRYTTDGTKDDELLWQSELRRLVWSVIREHVRLYHQGHVGAPCAQLSCRNP